MASAIITCASIIISFAVIGACDAQPPAPRRAAPPLYGVTVDDTGNVRAIMATLRHLPERPTIRIVFDVNRLAASYRAAVDALHRVSYLMAQPLDSLEERRIDAAAYAARVKSYLVALGSKIDIWEIGNEVNGDWTGSYQDVEAKLVGGYREVSDAHKKTVLTLYYNVGCGDGADELDPITFTRRFVPARVRSGLNYVLLSYYEQNCGERRPSVDAWRRYFVRLHDLYPHARLGFGEVGLTNPANSKTLPYAMGMIRYYYGLPIRLPYYVGGYFWWYGSEDVVPHASKPLFGTLRDGFAAERGALQGRCATPSRGSRPSGRAPIC